VLPDERPYSHVIEGRMGALFGDEVLEAGPGDLVERFGVVFAGEQLGF